MASLLWFEKNSKRLDNYLDSDVAPIDNFAEPPSVTTLPILKLEIPLDEHTLFPDNIAFSASPVLVAINTSSPSANPLADKILFPFTAHHKSDLSFLASCIETIDNQVDTLQPDFTTLK
jgi:hypothetical protein